MHNRQITKPTDADFQTQTELSHSALPQEVARLNSDFVILENQRDKLAAEEKQLLHNIHDYRTSEILQLEAEDQTILVEFKTDLNKKITIFLMHEKVRMEEQLMLEDLKTSRKLDESLYDEIFSHHTPDITFEQAIIKTLITHREIGMQNQFRIKETLNYYKAVLIQFLHLKVTETNAELYVVLRKANPEDFEDQLDRLERSGKVDKDTVNVAKQLRTVIESEKFDYTKLITKIAEFRKSIALTTLQQTLGKKPQLLYCLMPDLTRNDHFALVTTREIKEKCTAEYAQYSVLSAGITTISARKDVVNIRQSVQGFFTADIAVSREWVASQPEGTYGLNKSQWVFVLTFIEKLIKPRHWEDKSKIELDKIIAQSEDMINLLLGLKKFFFNKHSLTPLQQYISHIFYDLSVERDIHQLANEPTILTAHKLTLENLAKARARLAEVGVAKNEIESKLDARLDKPLLAILRMNVMHAAMLYLSGGNNNAGVLGCLLNLKRLDASQGKYWVLTLIQNLFDPELKQFTVAAKIMEKFFTRHAREYSGLAADSFDIFLMQTLFNEGCPKGLFRITAEELKKFRPETYDVPDILLLLPDTDFKKSVQRLAINRKDKTELLLTPDKTKLSSKIAELNVSAADKSDLQDKLSTQREADKMCLVNLKLIFENAQFMGPVLSGNVVDWLQHDVLALSQRHSLRFILKDNLLLLGNKLAEVTEAKIEAPRRGISSFSIMN